MCKTHNMYAITKPSLNSQPPMCVCATELLLFVYMLKDANIRVVGKHKRREVCMKVCRLLRL